MSTPQSQNIHRLRDITGIPKTLSGLLEHVPKSYESIAHHGIGSPDLVSTPDDTKIFSYDDSLMTYSDIYYNNRTYCWRSGYNLTPTVKSKTAIRIKFLCSKSSDIYIKKMSIGLGNSSDGNSSAGYYSNNHTPVTLNGEETFTIPYYSIYQDPDVRSPYWYSDWIDVSNFTGNEFEGSYYTPILIKFITENDWLYGIKTSNTFTSGIKIVRSDIGQDLVHEDDWQPTYIIDSYYNQLIIGIEVKDFGEIDDIYVDTLNDELWKKDGNPNNHGWTAMDVGGGVDTLVALTDTNISSASILDVTDPLNWVNPTGVTWDGTKWVVDYAYPNFYPDTWVAGFRPEYVRVTHTDAAPNFVIWDRWESQILSVTGLVSGQLYPINWGTQDIMSVEFNIITVGSHITKIEFVSGGGNTPNEGDILVADNVGIWYNTDTLTSLNVTNAVTAGSFVGDGSGLTNLPNTLVELTDTNISSASILDVTNPDMWGVTSNGFVWDGSQLTVSGTDWPKFQDATAWAIGFRPTHIKVVHNSPNPGYLRVVGDFELTNTYIPIIESGVEYPLTWDSDQNIWQLQFNIPDGTIISSIEFVSGGGNTPNEGDILVADNTGVWYNTDTIPVLNITNAVTAGSFVGDGSGLTNLPTSGVPRNVSNIVADGTEGGIFVQPSITTSINNVDVWVNGIKLIRTSEFTSDGTSMTILNPIIIALDDIEIITWE